MAISGEDKTASAANGITLDAAQTVLTAARKKAEEIGVQMNIAVVDAGGNLTAFMRMDNAWLGSIDIAQSKAFSARAFDMPTKDLGAESQSGKSLFGINASNQGKIIIFAGGIPLRENGKVVGAVGVSGGSVEQDQEVAEAGAAIFDAAACATSTLVRTVNPPVRPFHSGTNPSVTSRKR